MIAGAGEELDGETAVALAKTFRWADQWMARVERPQDLPVPGSDLEVDDRATHPRRVSYLALTGITAAVDHFHAASTLVSAGRIIHTNAQFTLLRAALENAATAVFLLTPEERKARIFRSLRVAWGDVVDHHNMLEQMRQLPKVSRITLKTELQAVAKAQGISKAEVAQVAARPLSYSSIVERAGVEAFGKDLGSLTLTIWMLNSGATHGKQWESITKIDRAQLLATADLDVKQGRVTAPSIQLRLSAAIACRMIEKAWTLYDLRRVV